MNTEEEKWYNNLEKLKEYIFIYDKNPSKIDKNQDIKKLGIWFYSQNLNFKNKNYIMKNENIYIAWKEFLNTRAKKYITPYDLWIETMQKVKLFIVENNKKPTANDNKKLCLWIYRQNYNYKHKKSIMRNETIYAIWELFVNDSLYKNCSENVVTDLSVLGKRRTDDEYAWYESLQNVRKFVFENNKKNISSIDDWIDKFENEKYITNQINNVLKEL